MPINHRADPDHEKREAFNAASALLAKNDGSVLRYVALELRRCIEAIVYQKLMIYGDLLPEGSVNQWQPPQAFDALIEIEPNAQETRTFAVAPQTDPTKFPDSPFKAIGVDQRPKARWIKETWHKLGSYLHADWPFAKKPKSRDRSFLEATLSDLTPLVNSSFSGMMSSNIAFVCAGCGHPVKVMAKAVEQSLAAVCLTCGMPYRAESSSDSFTFFPSEPPFTCECGAATFVPPKQIRQGYKFGCRSCDRNFQVVGFDWKYVVLEEGAEDSEE
jgi:hypothetical protein